MKIHLLVCAISIGEDDKGRGFFAALARRCRAFLGRRLPVNRPEIEAVATGQLPRPRCPRPGLHNHFAGEIEPMRRMI